MKNQRKLVLTVITFAFLVMVYGWFIRSGHSLSSINDRTIAVSRIAGIIATAGVLLEFLVMSRAPFIENNFSLEEINEFHRYNGYTIFYSLCVHIAFVVAGYSAINHTSLFKQFWNFPSQFSGMLSAIVGTFILIGVVGFSIKLIRKKLPYEVWYFIHVLIYGSIILTFSHQVDSGGDVSTIPWMKAYWYGLFALLFFTVAYYRFIRHIIKSLYHDFKVDKVVPEANGIYSIYVSGRRVNKFKYTAGQYAHWRFLTPNFFYQNHPFSYSSEPGSNHLRLTFKSSGDFTKQLTSINPGTRVLVDGPRGSFTAEYSLDRHIVMIAGGIGVSPFIPLAKSFLREGRDVSIIYSVVNREDIAFSSELNELLASHPDSFRLNIHVASEKGFINEAVLSNYVQPNSDEAIYLCGPPAMTKSLLKQLKSFGLADDQLITEQFSFD
jgi:predicted ferric reductase